MNYKKIHHSNCEIASFFVVRKSLHKLVAFDDKYNDRKWHGRLSEVCPSTELLPAMIFHAPRPFWLGADWKDIEPTHWPNIYSSYTKQACFCNAYPDWRRPVTCNTNNSLNCPRICPLQLHNRFVIGRISLHRFSHLRSHVQVGKNLRIHPVLLEPLALRATELELFNVERKHLVSEDWMLSDS